MFSKENILNSEQWLNLEKSSECYGPSFPLLMEVLPDIRGLLTHNLNLEVFEQTRRLRTLECRICPDCQGIGRDRSVREKCVRANNPIKTNKMKGAFSLNNILLGTVWPPDLIAAQNRESQIARFPESRAWNRQKFRSEKQKKIESQ